jgi:hypothetical protein
MILPWTPRSDPRWMYSRHAESGGEITSGLTFAMRSFPFVIKKVFDILPDRGLSSRKIPDSRRFPFNPSSEALQTIRQTPVAE